MNINNQPAMDESVGNSADAQQSDPIAPSQVSLSFGDNLLVFDGVPTQKVQLAVLILGGFEFNKRKIVRNVSEDPKRREYLERYYRKKKERCFENKIRYNVRQEIAYKLQRRGGKFAPKNAVELHNPTVEETDPIETECVHCGLSWVDTPMMRRGPNGPKTLCNACGLFWASKKILPDINKKPRSTSELQNKLWSKS